MPDDFKYDVFISYSSKDKEWVRGELLKRIELAGVKAFIDFRDFTRGAPSIKECERGVVECRKTLLILTPNYVEQSEWGEMENVMAQTLDPANESLRLIPLLKADCKKPLRIGALTHIDFTDGAELDLAWHQLLTALGAAPELPQPKEPEHPDWYLAHPYPMPPNFTGRVSERGMLTRWLNEDRDHPLLVLRALGGFGKSALTWHWLTHDVDAKRWPRVVWWSFYEGGPSFDDFVGETLAYLHGKQGTAQKRSPREALVALLNALHQPGTLLVLDGFERVLRAFSGLEAAYQGDDAKHTEHDRDCVSPLTENVLYNLALQPQLRSKVMLITRLTPRIVEAKGGGQLQGCREVELRQMQPEDAVAFFHAQGVRGTHTEIELACQHYGYHPLSLRLLAGLILGDLRQPGDIAAAKRLDVSGDLVQRQHHVLDQAYDRLTPVRQKLLGSIACFRWPVSYDTLKAATESDDTLDRDLRELVTCGLLHHDVKERRFDLHPIVRHYAYDRLAAPDRAAAHKLTRDYIDTPPEDATGTQRADILEKQARELIAAEKDADALPLLQKAMEAAPDRIERLCLEFGFLFDVETGASPKLAIAIVADEAKQWLRAIWWVASARNSFELTVIEAAPDPLPITPSSATGGMVAEPLVINEDRRAKPTKLSPERLGEALEEAVMQLFREFFQICEKRSARVFQKLRKQGRGLQFGRDVEFDWSVADNAPVICHVECKNYTGEISTKEVADKLLQTEASPKDVQHWILISPRANVSNELNELLVSWADRRRFKFDVQVWTPETGIEEFFGLAPELYDAFGMNSVNPHPKEWSADQRKTVVDKFRKRLDPSVRLPEGWETYLRTPAKLCMHREKPLELEALFALHVPVRGRFDVGDSAAQPVEDRVRAWLASEKMVLLLLAEFGAGKTSFGYCLARKLASEFRRSPQEGWIPVRFPLRDYWEAGTSRAFLERRLKEIGATLDGWKEICGKHRVLVILDGFDEMSRRLHPKAVTRNIDALLACCAEFENLKILVTSRTHFFASPVDKKRLLDRLGAPRILHLAPFSRQAVTQHLEQFAAAHGKQATLARIRQMHDPIGLGSKALFLEMLKVTLQSPVLPADLDDLTLYETYVNDSLRRKIEQLDDEERQADREGLIHNLIRILEDVAISLQLSNREYVLLGDVARGSDRSLANVLWRMSESEETQATVPAADAEADARAQIGIRSLLSRVEIRNMETKWPVDFCHRSIREYFVARALCRILAESGADQAEGKAIMKEVLLSHEILDFVAGLMRRETVRWQQRLQALLKEATRIRKSGHLGGNVVTLLYRLNGNQLPGTDWRGFDLDGADLAGADLTEKKFIGSSLRYANLDNATMENADFSDSDLEGVRFEETAPVVAVSVLTPDEQLLVAYGDGVVRSWDIHHPRNSTSYVVFSKPERTIDAIGDVVEGFVCVQCGQEFSVLAMSGNSMAREVARFPIRAGYQRIRARRDYLDIMCEESENKRYSAKVSLPRPVIHKAKSPSSISTGLVLDLHAHIVADDKCIRLIETTNVETLLCDQETTTLCILSLDPRRYLLGAGHTDGRVSIWKLDLQSRNPLSVIALDQPVHSGAVTSVTFMDDRRIISGSTDRRVCVTRFSMGDGKTKGELERTLSLTVRCKGLRVDGARPSAIRQKLEMLAKQAEGRYGENSSR
jgi:hypothetical protein